MATAADQCVGTSHGLTEKPLNRIDVSEYLASEVRTDFFF